MSTIPLVIRQADGALAWLRLGSLEAGQPVYEVDGRALAVDPRLPPDLAARWHWHGDVLTDRRYQLVPAQLGGVAQAIAEAHRLSEVMAPPAPPTLTFGSLFAGIGGFDLGFERAGLRCLWQVEKDPAARGVLARRWPHVPQYEDVCDCGVHNLAPVDVICAGFPCQGLSLAGRRAGLADARSGLFFEMVRIVDELRPTYLVWENVPGLLSSGRGTDMLTVLMELDRIGYSGAWTTLDARFFGVAQRRQRVFGVFAQQRLGARRCAEILSLAARLPGHPAPGAAAGEGSAASTGGGAAGRGLSAQGGAAGPVAQTICATGSKASPHGDGSETLIPCVAGTLGAAHGQNRGLGNANEDGLIVPVVAATIGQRMRGQDDACADYLIAFNAESYAQDANNQVAPTLAASHGHAIAFNYKANKVNQPMRSGGVAGTLQTISQEAVAVPLTAHHPRANIENDTLVAYSTSGQSTWRAGIGTVLSAQAHQNNAQAILSLAFGVRRLTPRECERLQGFPDDWTAGQSDTARYKQCGNAVAVPVAAWIGRRLILAHGGKGGSDGA